MTQNTHDSVVVLLDELERDSSDIRLGRGWMSACEHYAKKVRALQAQQGAPQGGDDEALAEVIDLANRAEELAERLVAGGPKASHVSCSETHEISEWILAAAPFIRTLATTPPQVPDQPASHAQAMADDWRREMAQQLTGLVGTMDRRIKEIEQPAEQCAVDGDNDFVPVRRWFLDKLARDTENLGMPKMAAAIRRQALATPSPVEAQREEMAAIGELIRTQDNRITDSPIFIVQQKRRICGMDEDYAEGFMWYDARAVESYDEAGKNERDAGREAEGLPPIQWQRGGYVDSWEFVTACFTEQGCKDYIARDGHNLREPRIYAAGSYRNEEWRAVRNYLQSLATPPSAAPAPSAPYPEYVIALLIAGGYVTQAKVDEARAIALGVSDAKQLSPSAPPVGVEGWQRMTDEAKSVQLRHLGNHQGDVYHAMQHLATRFGCPDTRPLTQPAEQGAVDDEMVERAGDAYAKFLRERHGGGRYNGDAMRAALAAIAAPDRAPGGDDRILWGIVANAGRLSNQRTSRWAHVMDAIGQGSTSAITLCRRFGFDPDECLGGSDPQTAEQGEREEG